jgi:arylformamidase
MKIIDLTHKIAPDMPVYPGTKPPVFTTEYRIEHAGFLEKSISIYSHTGTHIDAPCHIINAANSLDQFSVEHFYGNAFLLNYGPENNQYIEINHLEPHQDIIKNSDFLLVNTGWNRLWGTDRYFADYPVFSSEAALWLTKFNLKGIGSDTISADQPDSKDFPIHKIFLKNNILIVENLTNLEALPDIRFVFSCFPLKTEHADGSPVRAVAIIHESI